MTSNFRSVPWQRNINKIPRAIENRLKQIPSDLVIVAVTKRIKLGDISNGLYDHIGLSEVQGKLVTSDPILPPADMGRYSEKNIHGWEEILKDQPKVPKTFSWETPNFGDAATYGTHVNHQDRDVYQRKCYEPKRLYINTEVLKPPELNRLALIKFSIQVILDRTRVDFKDELLFCLNLLQENVGAVNVYPSNANRDDFIQMFALDWEFFPAGTAEEVVAKIFQNKSKTLEQKAVLEERAKLLAKLKTTAYFRGTGGFSSYFGAQFDEDLVVFENINYGNAIYVLYDTWEDVSKRSRLDLLKGTTENFDRFVHKNGWEDRFTEHLNVELKKRKLM